MNLESLKCVNFRNLADVDFLPVNGVNIVCGENGQGKTNLLEAVYMLTGAKSFRGTKDSLLIKRDCDFSEIKADFQKENRLQNIRMNISENKRTASINEGSFTSASALSGVFCCVIFSPEHLMMVKGSPDLRRKFLDSSLFQLYPAYSGYMKKYARVISQRNSLIKDAGYVSAAYEMIDVLDEQLAELAVRITDYRKRYVETLNPLAQEKYGKIAGNREDIDISYSSSIFGSEPADTERCIEFLTQNRVNDLKSGFTTAGPHRDDLVIHIDGNDSKVFASQGQQRSIVLSVKLAEAEMINKITGEYPVLLLDDVMSELDDARSEQLLASTDVMQSVITTCNPDLISKRVESKIFTMKNGCLS